MNNRVKDLREASLEAENVLDHERALLVTTFYRELVNLDDPIPVQRALCFKYIMENKKLYIGEQEVIVGERGPSPKATSTFPEISLHTREDLEMLHSRPKVSFKVSEKMHKVYEDQIIPFWKGNTNRDKLMALMTREWKLAYEAGIFTEFQEQRAPGHTVLGEKLWNKGMLDLIDQCNDVIQQLDFQKDPDASGKRDELYAMIIAAEALVALGNRYADAIEKMVSPGNGAARNKELHQMAAVCRRVPGSAPRTFHEALQHYWFIHLGVITELNPWDSFNPGRLDQHLQPFYEKGLNEGSLTPDIAQELLQCFWVKFNNHPAPPKIGVTAQESSTYTDFSLINVGGVKADGSDAVNTMTYRILDVIKEMRLLQPSSMVQVSKRNPDQFIHKALDIVKTGFGQPSVFNTDAIIQELLRQGKDIRDARNGGASGCVESGAFGTESYILTGYFNLAKILDVTLHNGFDSRTEKQIGLKTGKPESFNNFEEFMRAYEKQIRYFADIKIEGNLAIEKLFATELPVPFLSLLIDDCITNATDYNAGGARYNTSYIQGVGLGTVTDSLTALRYQVFGKKRLSLKRMVEFLDQNFNEQDDLLVDLRYKTPKYGNDDQYADEQATAVFNIFFNAVDDRPCYRGGRFRINMLPTTSHIYFGKVTGALPDGRKKGIPLSEGISPVQGADTKGPTAVLRSAAKIDHVKTGGTLLNQKFTPSFFNDEHSYAKLTSLIRTYFRLDGHHIQFNVVSADLLREAQRNPENYRDLIVRVAGYSDYFNDLGEDLQNEIILRTEHGSSF
ncbi:MAG: glycyl radical protein [Bacteroidales bacterium]|nr:glycyl radical protein [Bacteroidales bacterium]